MRPLLDRMLQMLRGLPVMIRGVLPQLPRYAMAGAWFFAIASMIPLLWLMFEGHNEGESSHVFGTTVGGVQHSIWGLTYSGTSGTILLCLEIIGLIAAIVMTALPKQMMVIPEQRLTQMRRIGHGYLTGWAGLWMLGTMHLASINPGFWTLQSIFITAMFACTVYRAFRECFPRKSKSPQISPDVAPPPKDLNELMDSDELPIAHRSYFRDDATALPDVLQEEMKDRATVVRVAGKSAAFMKRAKDLASRGLHHSRIHASRLITTIGAAIRPDHRST